jgi:hypothetical protein
MYTGVERRIFRRIYAEVPAKFKIGESHREYMATVRDISGGGVRISLFRKLTPGTVVDLEIFRSHPESSVTCKCEVVWLREIPSRTRKSYLIGARFLDLDFMYIGGLMNEINPKSV